MTMTNQELADAKEPCQDCKAKQAQIDTLRTALDGMLKWTERTALDGMLKWTDLQLYQYHHSYRTAAKAMRETKP